MPDDPMPMQYAEHNGAWGKDQQTKSSTHIFNDNIDIRAGESKESLPIAIRQHIIFHIRMKSRNNFCFLILSLRKYIIFICNLLTIWNAFQNC